MNQIRLSQIFRSICDLRLQQHRIWSFPILHVYTAITKLERKPYFPFLKAGFPAGAEHFTFLQLTNIRKKIVYALSLLPSNSNVTLPSNVYLRNMGSLKQIFFFFCVQ